MRFAKGFAARSQTRRAAAKEKLLAIRDVEAIPALESILSPVSDEAALAVLENVAAIGRSQCFALNRPSCGLLLHRLPSVKRPSSS